MAWIPCEDKLFSNPMTARLAGKTGWTINAAAGAILRLRCWCIEFAPDGDLRPFAPGEIAVALGESPADGERIVTALIECQWLETTPYFRVSDWWQIAGLFLRGRFKREPGVWKRIEKLYSSAQEDESPSGSLPSQEKREGATRVEQSAKVAEPCPGDGDPGPAPEQLRSGSGAAPELLSPNLPHPIQSYLSISDLNPQLQHHHPAAVEAGIDPNNSGPPGGIGYDKLAREICNHAGARRFSLADGKVLRELAATHGEKLIKACQYLHGGINNVPAYLRAVLEGRDDLKVFQGKR